MRVELRYRKTVYEFDTSQVLVIDGKAGMLTMMANLDPKGLAAVLATAGSMVIASVFHGEVMVFNLRKASVIKVQP